MKCIIFVSLVLSHILTVHAAFLNNSLIRSDDDEFLHTVIHQSAEQRWVDAFKNCGGSLRLSAHSGIKPAVTITAVIKKACLGIGNGASQFDIYGWDDFKKAIGNKRKRPGGAPLWARCHIIGRQLGGRGNVYANLFPCWQNKFNTPVMSNCERVATNAVKAGKTVRYETKLVYGSRNPWPTAIEIKASANGKKMYKVRIENTSTAKLTNI